MSCVEMFFDPGCPWTWITSRWLCEVAHKRGLDVRWRTYSLMLKNADNPSVASAARERWAAQFDALRVIEAARELVGEDAVGKLYAAFGTAIHLEGDSFLSSLEERVNAAGVDAAVLVARGSTRWDSAIEASTADARSLVGDDVGLPIIVLPGARERGAPVFFGPVLSPAPTGDAALALWDAYCVMAAEPAMWELKRSRTVGPQFS